MTTESASDANPTGSTKDLLLHRMLLRMGAPVNDSKSSEANAAPPSSPAEPKLQKQLLKKGLTRHAAPDPSFRESGPPKDYHNLFDSAPDEAEEERAIAEPQEISNALGEQQERYQAAQLQGASEVASSAPPTPVYHCGYYPPDAGYRSPMFLEHLKVPRDLNHGCACLGSGRPLFVNDIEAAWCVLLAPHRIPLRNVQVSGTWKIVPKNITTQSQAEALFWRWVSLNTLQFRSLKELREDRLLSYILDQRDLRIAFAHLIAKRHLHSVMEGLRQQSKSSAQDERWYGSVSPGTVHRNVAKKPRTTYAPAVVDLRSQQPSGIQPGAGLPVPMSSVTRGNIATSQAASASQSAAALVGLSV
ncbi:Hypothetical protein PHPALM_16784 [Phytophthora palmivora]|uniref:ATP-binding cassette (ABC) Superfamily n=1 Tax=Phytophthora palmivora TaxID=4796 RepID=A0A2P4XNX4_9STRA|nr:Hypothetical protein PHPALM_16784 [Phytophthora palmivora]